MPRLIRHRRGFSVAELLITLSMLSIIGFIVSRLVIGQQRFFQRANEQMGMRRELRTAMSLIQVETLASDCNPSPYLDTTLDATKERYRVTVASDIGDSVTMGSAVRFTRSMRYTLRQRTSGAWYIHRSEYLNGEWTAPVVVGGPYAPPVGGGEGGMRFAYFDSLGAPVTGLGNSRRVSRIDLLLRARGQRSSGPFGTTSTENTDSLALRIALRNRQ
ncbi:MAG: hypothetical protein EBV77_01785 [Gemmatimonadaceae bacterium]|nr:hypothetical protein [Gemmatimonadaceae bacterium]